MYFVQSGCGTYNSPVEQAIEIVVVVGLVAVVVVVIGFGVVVVVVVVVVSVKLSIEQSVFGTLHIINCQ